MKSGARGPRRSRPSPRCRSLAADNGPRTRARSSACAGSTPCCACATSRARPSTTPGSSTATARSRRPRGSAKEAASRRSARPPPPSWSRWTRSTAKSAAPRVRSAPRARPTASYPLPRAWSTAPPSSPRPVARSSGPCKTAERQENGAWRKGEALLTVLERNGLVTRTRGRMPQPGTKPEGL
jgi:hypothetical protein